MKQEGCVKVAVWSGEEEEEHHGIYELQIDAATRGLVDTVGTEVSRAAGALSLCIRTCCQDYVIEGVRETAGLKNTTTCIHCHHSVLLLK